jgi:hypothetical protein
MDEFPAEILVNIFSSLQLRDKHVMQRVNRLWKGAADIVIPKQKRLTVYPDNHAAGNGMFVKIRFCGCNFLLSHVIEQEM